MKLSNKHKAAIKSYLRAVAASGITVALAIVADIHPALHLAWCNCCTYCQGT
jgi:hypothetical protein